MQKFNSKFGYGLLDKTYAKLHQQPRVFANLACSTYKFNLV